MVPKKKKEKERNGTKKVLAEIFVHSYSGGGKEEGRGHGRQDTAVGDLRAI